MPDMMETNKTDTEYEGQGNTRKNREIKKHHILTVQVIITIVISKFNIVMISYLHCFDC